jgi:hypothetical protein
VSSCYRTCTEKERAIILRSLLSDSLIAKTDNFQGCILILSYLTVMLGFYFSSYSQSDFEDAQMVSLGSGHKGTGYYLRQQQNQK